jgi:hypothetical protein
MITWVDAECRKWSAHKRWMQFGEDGWPELSLLGRLIVEGPGAGHGTYVQRVPIKDPPEAYTSISISLQRMAETRVMDLPIRVVNAHYLFPGRAKQKAPQLEISLPQYWRQLHAAHAFIVGQYVPREASYTRKFACA